MKRWIAVALSIAAGTIITGIAAGCAPDTSAPTLAPRSTASGSDNQAVAQNVIPPTPILEQFTDVECLDCHTDQERLTTLAVAEEKTEALSSGPG